MEKQKKCFVVRFSELWISGRVKELLRQNELGPEKCLLKAQIHNLKASPCAVILSFNHQLPDNYTETSY